MTSAISADTAPILVTGAHRTGTTWVGKMLAAGGEALYINEPLSPIHRPGIFQPPTEHWYQYICTENEGPFLAAFQDTLGFRYHLGAEVRALRSLRDVARMGRDAWRFLWGRWRRRRPLLKDPFAVFSVPWFTQRLGVQAVVLVRHPAAVVSSWLRLRWVVPPWRLWQQPLLVRDWLAPYEDLVAQARAQNDPLITAAVLWRLITEVIQQYRHDPRVLVVRYEDLARQPESAFRKVYRFLGLDYNKRAQAAIQKSTSAKATETDPRHPHKVHLNSRAAVQRWKQRLTPEEIARIRRWVEPTAAAFYGDEEW